LDLEWNDDDELVKIQGDPILLDESIPKDEHVQKIVDEWRSVFENETKTVLTTAKGDFDNNICRTQECPV
jgi:5'-nucleotidase/UDP-sugar diphosphatase